MNISLGLLVAVFVMVVLLLLNAMGTITPN